MSNARRRHVGSILALALLVGGCGDDDSGGVATDVSGTDGPVDAGRDSSLDTQPERDAQPASDLLVDSDASAAGDSDVATEPDTTSLDTTSLDTTSPDTLVAEDGDVIAAEDGDVIAAEVGDDAEPEDVVDAVDAVPPECVVDDDCADELFCNGRERCFDGVCFASPTVPCRDQLDCTVEHCDEVEDRCSVELDDTRCGAGQVCKLKVGCFVASGCSHDEDCDDGVACNGVELCREHVCDAGTPAECDDGVACTSDECVEDEGGCQHVPIHAACLATELCSSEDGCTPRPPCDDDDDCDDASYCNGVETCDPTSRVCAPGVLPVVPDAVACTVDACSEEQAAVVHRPSAQRCTNGLYCDGAELCHPAAGCLPGAPPVTSDGVGCTVDRCDEDADFIEHTPAHDLCDDSLFCNGVELCHPLEGCAAGEPPPVNDGVGCTIDTCSEVQGDVLHVPSHELCRDALFCNGVESCDPEAGCVDGAPPVVDDGVVCTIDSCDDVADRVVHAPDHAACVDDDVCDGAETCHATLGCQAGTALAPGALCDDAPRSLCLAGVCGASVCGDLWTDVGRGEECDDGDDDDGDECTNDCHDNVVGYDGTYDLVPDVAYTCAQGLVSYNLQSVTFTVNGVSVTITGTPRFAGPMTGTLSGDSFTATLILFADPTFGGCDETYTLAGTFTSATAWSGTFTRRFDVVPGVFGGCGNCNNSSVVVSGTR